MDILFSDYLQLASSLHNPAQPAHTPHFLLLLLHISPLLNIFQGRCRIYIAYYSTSLSAHSPTYKTLSVLMLKIQIK